MTKDVHGRRFMEAIADCSADALNILIDLEKYLPIILNPHRCLDHDLVRILAFNGIDGSLNVLTPEKSRRLAILGPDLRAWRGAFRSHRTTAGALTGGAVVVRPYLVMRAAVDESSFDIVLLDDDDSDSTQIFVMGQGPQGQEYNESELSMRLDELAKPVLDELVVIPCYVLTAWRDGFAGWNQSGTPSLVITSIRGEYEAIDLGPAVDASPLQYTRAPTDRPETTASAETLWSTVWFKTGAAVTADTWQHLVYATEDGGSTGDGYGVKVGVGNDNVELFRREAGVDTSLGLELVDIPDGLDGPYHRLDLLVRKTATKTSVQAYVDMDPTAWYDDLVVAGRPDGTKVLTGLNTGDFTTGRLRLAAITASRVEG
jgi:hypothetical protein